jgi:hypothetical protein
MNYAVYTVIFKTDSQVPEITNIDLLETVIRAVLNFPEVEEISGIGQSIYVHKNILGISRYEI